MFEASLSSTQDQILKNENGISRVKSFQLNSK